MLVINEIMPIIDIDGDERYSEINLLSSGAKMASCVFPNMIKRHGAGDIRAGRAASPHVAGGCCAASMIFAALQAAGDGRAAARRAGRRRNIAL